VIASSLDVPTAVRAAGEVAARYGVAGAEPVLLRDGSNVLVHLAPAPVVARVASLTAEVRPDVWDTLAKDVALAGYLAGRGAPVVAPSGVLPPGPHMWQGRTLTFWTYVEHDRGYAWQPGVLGPLLAELHAELRGFPGELSGTPPLDARQVVEHLRCAGGPTLLGEAELDDFVADAERLTADLAALGDEPVPLHGDAHPGNLLHTARGPVWTDFEDAWRGPVGWDLACLANSGKVDGRAAVAGYPGAPDAAGLAPYVAARRLQGIGWTLVFLQRFPTPERRADVLRRIRAWRENR
jgi:hypothetical protein